eukprot:scaffold14.g1216.t1
MLEAAAGLTGVEVGGRNPVDVALDTWASLNITVLRTFATGVTPELPLLLGPGKYNEVALRALDALVDGASRRGLRVTLILARNWGPPDSKSIFAGWSSLPFPDDFFTSPAARQAFKARRGGEALCTGSGGLAKEALGLRRRTRAWRRRLCRAPPPLRVHSAPCRMALQNWIEEMSAFLKSVAPNQLVAIGSEGFFGRGDPLAVHNPGGGTAEWVYQIGQDFAKNSAAKGIDYAEIHAWPDNWNNSDPDFLNNWVQAHMQSAQALGGCHALAGVWGKPLVLEEFGKNVTDHLRATIARVRNPVFATLFATLNQSLASGGVLKGAQYWMADPSLTGPNSPGWANYSQDQVVPSESTMVEIIAPAARAAAAHAAPVPGCSPQLSNGVDSKARGRRPRWQPRFHIVLACFLATLVAYVERVGFSIAYTAMAKQAEVLSAFFWGYGLSQIPGGWAAQRYGGSRMLSLSFLAWSLASILTPASAANTRAIVAARVCGFLIPAVHTVLAAWVPPNERARAVSLTTSGMYLGSAMAMQALPAVAARLGAPALLRVVGGLGLAWLALWQLTLLRLRRANVSMPLHSHAEGAGAGGAALGAVLSGGSRPLSSSAGRNGGGAGGGGGRRGATPWRAMLSHPAVWAIVINNYTFHYAFYVIMNWLPTYFDKVLHAGLGSLGPLRVLPYLTMFAASNAGGWAGDYLINARRRSVAAGRKLVNTAGFWAAAAALALMPGARGVAGGVAATTAALGACGFARGGFSVNHMDIAPRFAGMVMGISNTAGTLSGVVGVAVTGYLLQRAGGAEQAAGWYQVLALCAVQCATGSLVFLAFARGERLFGSDTPDAADF